MTRSSPPLFAVILTTVAMGSIAVTTWSSAVCVDYGRLPRIVGSVDLPGTANEWYYTPGRADDVKISGEHAFVSASVSHVPHFFTLDVADPEHPTIVGSIELPLGFGGRIAVSGDFVVVKGNTAGILVLDVSEPSDPQIASILDTPGNAFDVAVTDSHAYVPGILASLLVIDLQNPFDPRLIHTVTMPANIARVQVLGERLYIAQTGADPGLHVMDVSLPNAPRFVAFIETETPPKSVDTLDALDHVLIVNEAHALRILDVASPTDVGVIGSLTFDEFTSELSSSGSAAFLRASTHVDDTVVLMVDLTVPESPRVVAHLDPGAVSALVAVDRRVYVAARYAGLVVLDCHEPKQVRPQVVPTPRASDAVAASPASSARDLFYMAERSGLYGPPGLKVVDVTNPDGPEVVGFVEVPVSARGVFVHGDWAYVAAASAGLQIIDAANPRNPRIVGALDTENLSHAVSVVDDYAYILDWDKWCSHCKSWSWHFLVADVSDPAAPEQVGYVTFGYEKDNYAAYDLEVRLPYAYVASGRQLRILDVGDPQNPTLAAEVQLASARGVALRNDYALVVDAGHLSYGPGRLHTIDISDPTDPRIVGEFHLPDRAHDIELSGDHAFISGFGSLQILDVSNPLQPSWIGTVNLPYFGDSPLGGGVAVSRTHVGIASSGAGLQIIPIQCRQTAPPPKHSSGATWSAAMSLFPNPASGRVQIRFDAPGLSANVRVEVFDLAGRRIRRLETPGSPSGRHEFVWDGRDTMGEIVASGVYFVRASAQNSTFSRTITFLR